MIEPLLCALCLGSADARVIFVAVFKDGTTADGPATGANALARWHETVDPVALKWYEYAVSRHVLLPVAVWQGTPVCEPHLWDVLNIWRQRGGR